jgi:hypothetical protein
MSSPTLRWFFDPETGKWYASYQLPNSTLRIFYEATGKQLDAIFGANMRPTDYTNRTFANLTNRQTFSGGIGEVQVGGSFESHVKRVIALALDDGELPDWAKQDAAVEGLLYVMVTEDKSAEWFIEKAAKLDSFKARFPHLQKLIGQGLSTTEAVSSFLEFEAGVKKTFAQYGRKPDAVDPNLIGKMLVRGHSLDDVNFVFSGFETLRQNKGAFQAFNQVLAARGLDPLGKRDQLDFLAGRSPVAMYRIWEEASFNRAAQDAGLDIGVRAAMRLARRTEGMSTYDQALEGLQNAASSILRYRADLALERYDLDQDDLIDISLGLAPRSGRSQADVGRNMERALAAGRAGVDGPRATRFRRFSDEGVPEGVSTTRSRTRS